MAKPEERLLSPQATKKVEKELYQLAIKKYGMPKKTAKRWSKISPF